MSYLKRNINVLLLITAVLSIGFIFTLVAYYQNTFEKVTVKYYEQVNEYESLIENFQEREKELNATSFELTRKTQTTEKLGELYTDVVSERDKLSSDLRLTKSQLEDAQSTIITQNNKITTLNTQNKNYNTLSDDASEYLENVTDSLKISSNLTDSQIDTLFDDLSDTVFHLKGVS